jgi:hypothetical protein
MSDLITSLQDRLFAAELTYSVLALTSAFAVLFFLMRSAIGTEKIGALSSSSPGKGALVSIIAMAGLGGVAFDAARSLFRHLNRLLFAISATPIPEHFAFSISLISAPLIAITIVVIMDRYSVLRVNQSMRKQIDMYSERVYSSRTSDELRYVIKSLEAEADLARTERNEIARRYGRKYYQVIPAKETNSAADIRLKKINGLLGKASLLLMLMEKQEDLENHRIQKISLS